MVNHSARAQQIGGFGAESGGVELHNHLNAVAPSLANHELRQRLQLIIHAYDLLAAGRRTAGVPGLPPKPGSRTVFTGGHAFSFGPFQLFPSRRLLLKRNRAVQIGGRAFDILTILVERAGEIVGKEELIARGWPNVFVDDSNLKTQVSLLRRVLGEGRSGRCHIVTVSGRGYNFVAPVRVSECHDHR